MTAIEWTDETWNPTIGCTKVSPGCKNCYAETMHARLTAMGQPKYAEPFSVVKPWPDHLDAPLHWRKPRRVFVNSMSDLFHEDVPFNYIDDVFAIMALSPIHTFQVLTKRPNNAWRYLSSRLAGYERRDDIAVSAFEMNTEQPNGLNLFTDEDCIIQPDRWPLPNVHLGVSVEDQERADERIPHLLETPAAVRFLSCEPLLGPLVLDGGPAGPPTYLSTEIDHPDDTRINWVICGSESGKGARPMDLAWARSLRDQCAEAGVPFFMKQLCHNGRKIPFEEWPEDLQVREWSL